MHSLFGVTNEQDTTANSTAQEQKTQGSDIEETCEEITSPKPKHIRIN